MDEATTGNIVPGLGARIRHARTLAGYDRQIDFLTALHNHGAEIAQSTLSAWENDRRIPDLREALILADVLNVPLDYLGGLIELPGMLSETERGVVVSKEVGDLLEQLGHALAPKLTEQQQLALQLVEQIAGSAA